MTTEPITSVRATVTIQVDGKSVLVTLGGADESEVLERIAQVIANHPDSAPVSYPFAHEGRRPQAPTVAKPEGLGA